MTESVLRPGIIPPLVTLLDDDGRPDAAAMALLVESQIAAGVDGVLAVGSMGELGNLDPATRAHTVAAVATSAAGRIPVWAGVGGLGTMEAVQAARAAADSGADALVVLPPLFFDSSDAELAAHFEAVAVATPLPVIAYDVPARSPRPLPADVLVQLASDGVIAGVKDSSGDFAGGRLLVEALADHEHVLVYAGGEITIDTALSLGFDGSVPGFANVFPEPAVAIWRRHRNGDPAGASQAQRSYLELFEILRVPLPGAGGPALAVASIKLATAHVLGLGLPRSCPPLTQPTTEYAARVTAIVDSVRSRWTDADRPVEGSPVPTGGPTVSSGDADDSSESGGR